MNGVHASTTNTISHYLDCAWLYVGIFYVGMANYGGLNLLVNSSVRRGGGVMATVYTVYPLNIHGNVCMLQLSHISTRKHT